MAKVDSPSDYSGENRGFVIAGHFNEPDTYSHSRPSGMEDWLITYTIGGEGYFKTPEKQLLCMPGDVTLLRFRNTASVWHIQRERVAFPLGSFLR